MCKKTRLYSFVLPLIMLTSLSGNAQHILKLDTDTFYIVNVLKMMNPKEVAENYDYFKDTAYFVVLKNNEEIEKKLKCGRLTKAPVKFSRNLQKKKIRNMYNIIQKYYVANYIIEPYFQNFTLALSLFDERYYAGAGAQDRTIVDQLSILGLDSLTKEKTQGSSLYTQMPERIYPPPYYYYRIIKVKMTYIAIKDERELYKGQLCFSCSSNRAVLSSMPGTDSTLLINAVQLEILPPIQKITNKKIRRYPPGYLEKLLPIQRLKKAKK